MPGKDDFQVRYGDFQMMQRDVRDHHETLYGKDGLKIEVIKMKERMKGLSEKMTYNNIVTSVLAIAVLGNLVRLTFFG